ncbi:MAG: protein translocase subunit SecD [Mycobacteriales bacterium]
MAAPSNQLKAAPYFASLAGLLVLLYLFVTFGSTQTPKLGLDLKGGTTVTLQARGGTPNRDDLNTARNIIENRVNGLGVSGSTVVVEGSNRIVISVPGDANSDQVKQLGTTAKLYFRPLLLASPLSAAPAPTATTPTTAKPTATAKPTPTARPTTKATRKPTARPTTKATAKPTATSAPTTKRSATSTPTRSTTPSRSTPSRSTPSKSAPSKSAPSKTKSTATSGSVRQSPAASTSAGNGSVHNFAGPLAAPATAKSTTSTVKPTPAATASVAPVPSPAPSAPASNALPGVPQSLQADIGKSCTALLRAAASVPPDKPLVSCDQAGGGRPQVKYVLAPSILSGTQVSSAAAQYGAGSTAVPTWTIQLKLKGKGQTIWSNYTAKNNCNKTGGCDSATDPAADFVAFVLDGQVVSAPGITSTIDGPTQITGGTGGFTADEAKSLSNQLKFGALPLSFERSTATTISPTLGSAQLKAGLLAGGIGLALVIVYSLIYYRALRLVTIASLLVSAALVYSSVVLLGQRVGFTLSLAGIAGFIVAVGITADSFVVFFERLKEEVHEGRSMRSGVPRAWVRARRTILSADAVSFLAAAILYYLAAGDVRGFAFTLGLSTILDLIVVFLFTHPIILVLSRSKSFALPRMSGLGKIGRTGRAERAAAGTLATAGGPPVSGVSGTTAAERAAARRARARKES